MYSSKDVELQAPGPQKQALQELQKMMGWRSRPKFRFSNISNEGGICTGLALGWCSCCAVGITSHDMNEREIAVFREGCAQLNSPSSSSGYEQAALALGTKLDHVNPQTVEQSTATYLLENFANYPNGLMTIGCIATTRGHELGFHKEGEYWELYDPNLGVFKGQGAKQLYAAVDCLSRANYPGGEHGMLQGAEIRAYSRGTIHEVADKLGATGVAERIIQNKCCCSLGFRERPLPVSQYALEVEEPSSSSTHEHSPSSSHHY